MSRRVEVLNTNGSHSHYVSVDEARRLLVEKQVSEMGSVIVQRSEFSKRANWQPKQSGYAGPLVLQMV